MYIPTPRNQVQHIAPKRIALRRPGSRRAPRPGLSPLWLYTTPVAVGAATLLALALVLGKGVA